MASIFILEDTTERIEEFKNIFKNHLDNVYIATNYEEALSLLSSIPFDILFLDHDLGGNQIVTKDNWEKFLETEEKSGSDVARWLIENITNSPLIVVHSYNPYGAKNMLDILTKAGFQVILAPFYTKPFFKTIEDIKTKLGLY